MKDTEYAFAVAKIRANENNLINAQTMENVITAQDFASAKRLLSEAGFADFSAGDVDEILSKKSRDAFELIVSCAPDRQCLDFLIVKNDFHNIKAFLKSMATRQDCEKYLLSPSIISYETLKKALEQKDYKLLPDFAAESAKHAYDVLMRTMDGQLVDIILDKASLEAQLTLAKLSKDAFSIKLANQTIAVTDIKIALRAQRTGKEKSFYEDALAKCDLFSVDSLISASLSGLDDLAEFVKQEGFAILSECMKKSDTAFEKQIDDMLIDYVKNARFQSFGIAPLIAYYFASESEIKTIRIILSCKKNGFDVQKIRERVRKLYV